MSCLVLASFVYPIYIATHRQVAVVTRKCHKGPRSIDAYQGNYSGNQSTKVVKNIDGSLLDRVLPENYVPHILHHTPADIVW